MHLHADRTPAVLVSSDVPVCVLSFAFLVLRSLDQAQQVRTRCKTLS